MNTNSVMLHKVNFSKHYHNTLWIKKIKILKPLLVSQIVKQPNKPPQLNFVLRIGYLPVPITASVPLTALLSNSEFFSFPKLRLKLVSNWKIQMSLSMSYCGSYSLRLHSSRIANCSNLNGDNRHGEPSQLPCVLLIKNG